MIPKIKVELTENFDNLDLGVESIRSWKDFEMKFCKPNR